MSIRSERGEMTMPKNKKSKGPTLSAIYNEVAARADTEGLEINVAETKRVLACFFDILADHSAPGVFHIVAKGLRRAGRVLRFTSAE
jgi:hypothetical protein